jgi:hypothetical protein
LQVPGNIKKDVVERVISVKLTPNNEIHYELKYNKRYDGTVPTNSSYPSEVVRKMYPQEVIDYIEDRMKQKMIKK